MRKGTCGFESSKDLKICTAGEVWWSQQREIETFLPASVTQRCKEEQQWELCEEFGPPVLLSPSGPAYSSVGNNK